MDPAHNQNQPYESPWTDAPRRSAPQDEQKNENLLPARPKSKKALILTVLALLLAIGIVAFLFAVRSPAKPNVDVTIPSPGKVLVGQPFVLDVSFSNLSDGVLKAAGVSVMLPDGVSFLGQSPDQRVMEVPIGDIGPGSVNNQNFN